MAAVLASAIMVPIGREIDSAYNRHTITATVTDKAVKNSDNTGIYLIYGCDENGEITVMEITDNLLAGRFDSSDMYASIETGKTYKFTVGGSRVNLLSWYPNIYEAEECISSSTEES